MQTHLFPILICTSGAKLVPEAFRSASVSMTLHKSYIINLREMSDSFATHGSSAVRLLAWTPRRQTVEENKKKAEIIGILGDGSVQCEHHGADITVLFMTNNSRM